MSGDVLTPSETGTRVTVAVAEVDPGKTYSIARSEKTQVVYVLEGKDATIVHTGAGKSSEYKTQRRAGLYLEPGDEGTVTASATPLLLLLVTVPKHTSRSIGDVVARQLLLRGVAAPVARGRETDPGADLLGQ